MTNQRGVARGMVAAEDLEIIHENMVRELAAAGARIDDIFCCPHEEEVCQCRKPKPGLVYMARDKWDLDLAHSLLIGDSESDARLAQVCGIPFLRASNGRLV